MPIKEDLRRLFYFLKSYLLQFNLFKTGTQNETIIQNERRSTRIYLILLIISSVAIILYARIIFYQEIIIIPSPSLKEYHRIKEETSLQCPCSNIAMKYEIFTEIDVHYHELCESDFVLDEWINHLFRLYDQCWNKSVRIDFCRIGAFQFQTLRSLCQLSKDTINKSLQLFNNTDLVQSHLILPELFRDQIDSSIREFTEEAPKTFLRTLNFIQNISAQSLFMTGASITSVQPVSQYSRDSLHDVGIVPYPGINYTFTNGVNCVCSSSTATTCMGLTVFNNITVPGFQTGCYMLSALMNSTVEAFYNQTFINILSNSSQRIKKLNSSNSTDKIEMLLSKMFVISWSNKTFYDKYFQSCAPESCLYTKMQHYSFWNTFLLLCSLLSGLSKTLKIVTIILISRIWLFIQRKICKRQVPDAPIDEVEIIPRKF